MIFYFFLSFLFLKIPQAKIEQQKRDGTYKTKAEKERLRRQKEILEQMKEAGIIVDAPPKSTNANKKKKKKTTKQIEPVESVEPVEEVLEIQEPVQEPEKIEEIEVVDDWDDLNEDEPIIIIGIENNDVKPGPSIQKRKPFLTSSHFFVLFSFLYSCFVIKTRYSLF